MKNTKTMCIKLNHPEASTVFNLICTEEQVRFLQFLANISENVSMNRYEPTMSLSEGVGICESDAFSGTLTKKAFTFDATILSEDSSVK